MVNAHATARRVGAIQFRYVSVRKSGDRLGMFCSTGNGGTAIAGVTNSGAASWRLGRGMTPSRSVEKTIAKLTQGRSTRGQLQLQGLPQRLEAQQ
jgi:hypothetical protein